MKQSLFTPQHVVRSLALVAGVLGVAFVAAPPVAEARGLPAPHQVARELHQRVRSHVRRVVDHSDRSFDMDRRDHHRRYPRSGYHSRYNGPSYRHPVVVRGYRPYRSTRGYVGGYVGLPPVGIAVGVTPHRRVYRDDDCDRCDDCDRNGYSDDDRRRYDDDDDDDYDD